LKLHNLIADYYAQDFVRGKQTKTVPKKNKKSLDKLEIKEKKQWAI